MSEPIPESIPTSSDPRSKRPTKRLALTPTSQQASQLSTLFSNPEKEIVVPASGPQKPRGPAAPPEIVANVQGSSAGAGSGEFHVYKASRRREYERLKGMEEEVKEEKEQEEWERQNEERKKMDDEKTERNRKKRRGKGNKDKKGASKKEVMEKGMQVDEKVKDGDQNGTTANPDEIGVVFLEDD